VAQRVADERAEKVGQTVGYSIRLETVKSSDTRLLFVTTGVLLRRLQNDPWLVGISHLILDEVHERDVNSDFLLIILRYLVQRRSDIKVILMSATINAESFANYFAIKKGSPIPMLEIPGKTFPVSDFYLEDAIESTKYTLGENSPYAMRLSQSKASHANNIAKKFANYSKSTQRCLELMDSMKINYELIEKLIVHICQTYGEGGMLGLELCIEFVLTL